MKKFLKFHFSILNSSGFTLVELLTVITIIAILAGIGLVNFQGVQSKGRDSTRKSDLRALSSALEIYFQKNDGYIDGTPGVEGDCTGADTAALYSGIISFMANQNVPVDPQTSAQYCYISVGNGQSFRLFAALENNDSDSLVCDSVNYFTTTSQDLTKTCPSLITPTPTAGPSPTTAPTSPPSSPTPTNAPTAAPTPTPTPTPIPPTPTPACTPGPQTFLAASTDDGYVKREGGTWPPNGPYTVDTGLSGYIRPAHTWTTDSNDNFLYVISNGLARFDTSSIPDTANITSAAFRAFVVNKADGAIGRQITADWYDFGSAISDDDWTATPGTSAISGIPIASGIFVNTYNSLPLNAPTNISKTGYTGLRFHISGGQSTGEYVTFYPVDSANNVFLDVTYTCP